MYNSFGGGTSQPMSASDDYNDGSDEGGDADYFDNRRGDMVMAMVTNTTDHDCKVSHGDASFVVDSDKIPSCLHYLEVHEYF